MTNKRGRGESTATAQVSASSESCKDLPGWFAQATVWLTLWQTSGLVESLKGLRWARASKCFEAVDMVLVLLLLVVSGASGVRSFYRDVNKHSRDFEALAAIWGRERLPSRSGFSGMMKAVESDLVAQLVPLFCRT